MKKVMYSFLIAASCVAFTSCSDCVNCTDCGNSTADIGEICKDDYETGVEYTAAKTAAKQIGCTCE